MPPDFKQTCFPYVLGRILAIAEALQMRTGVQLNTSVRTRYYDALINSPGATLPELMGLCFVWLNMLSGSARVFFDSQLMQACSLLPVPPQDDSSGSAYYSMLKGDARAAYVIGYAAQRYFLFAPKGPKEQNQEGTSDEESQQVTDGSQDDPDA